MNTKLKLSKSIYSCIQCHHCGTYIDQYGFTRCLYCRNYIQIKTDLITTQQTI